MSNKINIDIDREVKRLIRDINRGATDLQLRVRHKPLIRYYPRIFRMVTSGKCDFTLLQRFLEDAKKFKGANKSDQKRIREHLSGILEKKYKLDQIKVDDDKEKL